MSYLLIALLSISVYNVLFTFGQGVAGLSIGADVQFVGVGYGPRLFAFRVHETTFAFSLIPLFATMQLGGGETVAEQLSGFDVGRRVLILSAGPLATITGGFLMLAGSWWIGRSEPQFVHRPAQVRWIRSDSDMWTGSRSQFVHRPAEVLWMGSDDGSDLRSAGVVPGDRIMRADLGGGEVTVGNWRDLAGVLVRSSGDTLRLDCRRGNATVRVNAALRKSAFFDLRPATSPVVGRVQARSPAELAGFRVGDRITKIAGIPISDWSQMELFMNMGVILPIEQSRYWLCQMEVMRNGRVLVLRVAVPQAPRDLGLRPSANPTQQAARGFVDGLKAAAGDAMEAINLAERMLLGQGEFSSRADPRSGYDVWCRGLSVSLYSTWPSSFLVLVGTFGIWIGLFNLVPAPGTNGRLIALELMIAYVAAIWRRGRGYSRRSTLSYPCWLSALCAYSYTRGRKPYGSVEALPTPPRGVM